MKTRRKQRQCFPPCVPAAALLLAAVACGSGGEGSDAAPAAPDTTTRVAAPPPPPPAAREVVRAPEMDGDVVLVDVQEVRAKLEQGDPVLVIDARPAADYEHEHIPGSVNVPLGKLAAAGDLPGVPRDHEIVVYCISPECPISKNAARALARLGYRNVKDMREGLVGWKRAGLPTERGDA